MIDYVQAVFSQVAAVANSVLPEALIFAAIFTALAFVSSHACNPGRTWWKSRALAADICYMLIMPFFAPYLRMVAIIGIAALLLGLGKPDSLTDFFQNGHGPLSRLPFWGQVAIYLLLADFLLYWIHRIFHGRSFWRFHAIHHSAEDLDWTAMYRFHPVNLMLGPFFVNAAMLFLGVSPKIVLMLVPFDVASAAFVHANLNWTLGPLKYLVATPVFHRWHHTGVAEGGEKNFAPTFSFWDVLFGTFYMPAGQLPQAYGVDDKSFPRGFLGQMAYPFRGAKAAAASPQTTASTASPSAP